MNPNSAMGLTPEPITDEEELRHVWKIAQLSATIPALIKRWDSVAEVAAKPNSEMAHDDAATHWWAVGSVVTTALHQAADTLHTLHRLLPAEGDISIPFMSHYPIARASLEATSLGLWLVGPEDPKDRIHHHLEECWREVYEENTLRRHTRELIKSSMLPTNALNPDLISKQNKAWSRKRMSYIREVAQRWGLPDPINGSRVGFAQIVREAAAFSDVNPDTGEIIWRQLSGLSHPSFTKSAQDFRREILTDDGDGNLQVRLSSSLTTLELALSAITLHFARAVETVAARKIRPVDRTRYPGGVERP